MALFFEQWTCSLSGSDGADIALWYSSKDTLVGSVGTASSPPPPDSFTVVGGSFVSSPHGVVHLPTSLILRWVSRCYYSYRIPCLRQSNRDS